MHCSVEIAHTDFSEAKTLADLQIEQSCQVATRLVRRLQSLGVTVETALLIDDKNVSPDLVPGLTDAVIAVAHRHLPVDWVCRESRLAEYVDAFTRLLPGPTADREYERLLWRLRKFGTLPCSADIAIWHLLRLGAVDDANIVLEPTDAQTPFVPADVVVSVLPETLSDVEDQADISLLRHVRDGQFLPRIYRLYFGNERTHQPAETQVDSHVDEITEEMLTNA